MNLELDEILQKFEKVSNFIQKLLKLDLKNVDHHSINFRSYALAYYRTLEEVPGPLVPEKTKKKQKKLRIV